MARSSLHRKRLAAVLLSTLISLGVAEIAIRFIAPQSRDHAIPGGLFAVGGELGWQLEPGREVRHRSQYFEATYRTNVLGMRDRAWPDAGPQNSSRVVFYGDSLVFGWGLDAAERFSDQLDQMDHLDVWNRGVPGYGLDQQLLAFEADAPMLSADRIVLQLSMPSVRRMEVDYIFQKYKPQFVLAADGGLSRVPIPQLKDLAVRTLYGAISPFYLPYFVERRLAMLLGERRSFDRIDQAGPEGIAAYQRLEPLIRSILLRGSEAAHRNGAELTIFSDLPDGVTAATRLFAKENGIGFIAVSLTQPHSIDQLTFGVEDRHWNAVANRYVFEALRQGLPR